MIFEQLAVGSMQNFSYIVGDEDTGDVAVIDPGWDLNKILNIVEKKGLKVRYIINTHSHSDHTEGNIELKKKTGAKIVAHTLAPVKKEISVEDGDVIRVGGVEMKVIYTPGHTQDSICLLVDGKLVTGDTLFVGECGRTDLVGGSSEQMYESLFNKILKLDDSIEVYPGHDYGSKPYSTIGFERRYNYTLQPRTKEEFVRFVLEP